MVKFEKLQSSDFEENKLVIKLLEIGRSISKEQGITISNIEFDKVFFDNDSWIDINFEIKCNNPKILAQMNIALAENLAEFRNFLSSDVEYIPSFLSQRNNYDSFI